MQGLESLEFERSRSFQNQLRLYHDQSDENRSEILRSTVRYLVMAAGKGQDLVNATGFLRSVLPPGRYQNLKLTAAFLIELARVPLETAFGLKVTYGIRTLKDIDPIDVDGNLLLRPFSVIRVAYADSTQPNALDDIAARKQMVALVPTVRAQALRGVLFTILSIILCEETKKIATDKLVQRLVALGCRDSTRSRVGADIGSASAAAAEDENDDEEEGVSTAALLPTIPTLLKQFKKEQLRNELLESSIERMDADILEEPKTEVIRIGERARSLIGVHNLLTVICNVTGVALPAEARLPQALGPENVAADPHIFEHRKRGRNASNEQDDE